jgi:hypothetical protein
MDVRRIINEVSLYPTGRRRSSIGKNHPIELAAKRVDGRSVFIEYALPGRYAGLTATVEIRTLSGELLWRLSQTVRGYRNHFRWDFKNRAGANVSKGAYAIRLCIGGKRVDAAIAVV